MKRFSKAVVTVVSGAIVAVVSAAGVDASGMLSGHFSFDSADANAYWYTAANAQVSVNRSTFVFRPTGGGQPNISHATLLYVTLQTGAISGSDCFVIPDADFVEGTRLQTATLSVTVDSSNLCTAVATPLGDVIAGAGDKGGPPPQQSPIPLPMTVSVAWAGNGVVTSGTQSGHTICSTYTAMFQDQSSEAFGSASGTLTFYDGTSPVVLPGSDLAVVDKGSFQSDSQGTLDPRCFGI